MRRRSPLPLQDPTFVGGNDQREEDFEGANNDARVDFDAKDGENGRRTKQILDPANAENEDDAGSKRRRKRLPETSTDKRAHALLEGRTILDTQKRQRSSQSSGKRPFRLPGGGPCEGSGGCDINLGAAPLFLIGRFKTTACTTCSRLLSTKLDWLERYQSDFSRRSLSVGLFNPVRLLGVGSSYPANE